MAVQVLAHRGDSANFPENTLPAFESAVKMGVDIIETDVHLSLDNVIVVWHDDTLERLSGDKRTISQMTWQEIKEVNAGYNFTPDNGKTYPYRQNPLHPVRLDELLIAFKNVRFNIDLKDNSKKLIQCYGEMLKKNELFGNVVTASFHSPVLKLFRKSYPKGQTSCTSGEILFFYIINKIKLIHIPFPYKKRILQMPEFHKSLKLIDKSFVKNLQKRGLKIQVWTVNEESDMRRFIEMGVDGIFTDKPDLLQKCLNKLKNN